jgi:four helix bundle protein
MRPEELQQRLVLFGVTVCRQLAQSRQNPITAHVVGQLIRSATAPAAIYAEARAAESRRDFVHKMQIGLKELRESAVWLQFMKELASDGSRCVVLSQECGELIAIFVASLKTARG